MANKYIIHGATYCGDGTTSSEAASAGAVGAWNNINVFMGTAPAYGTLAAGDVVTIRSKDASNNNIVFTLSASANYGSASATSGLPIIWTIDDGSVWPSISGTLTFVAPGHESHSLISNNVFNASPDNNLIFTTSYASYGPGYNVPLVNFIGCVTRNIVVDTGVVNATNQAVVSFGGVSAHYSPKFKNIRNWGDTGYFQRGGWVTHTTLFDPLIELTYAQTNYPLITGAINTGGNSFRIFGGEIYGAGATENVPLFQRAQCGDSNGLFNTKFPRGMVLSNSGLFQYDSGHLSAVGADGVHGAMYIDYVCKYDSRSDGYYPTREATLETGAAWSYKFYSYRASKFRPANVVLAKLYSLADDIRTVRVDFLWPETLAAPTQDVVSISVAYTDATTGGRKTLSTYRASGGVVEVSTATWSATTYGSVAFSKRKLEITTPTAVKKDTDILVTLSVAVNGVAQSTDVVFIDPDVTVE